MRTTVLIKASIILLAAIIMVVIACNKKTNDPPVVLNEVSMKFNGAEWKTIITTGTQTASTISVGSFTDAGTAAESFFLEFDKSKIKAGSSADATALNNYQIQHNGTNYTISSASFSVVTLSSTRFEVNYTMTLSGGATITDGKLFVNL